jgi:PucR family transcriptional regulator, purine catabolism regulatory protein
MGTTIKKISQSCLFKEIPLLAGLSGIDNRVDYVTICNSPILSLPNYDLDDYVLVITSFSVYYKSIDKMKAMIIVLSKQHVSGICVKVDSYLKSMPEELIELCNQLKIPLFACNSQLIPYRKIIAAVDREIIETQINQLKSENEQYNVLYELITNGKSVSDCMEILGKQLNCNCGGISCEHKLLGYFEMSGASITGFKKWTLLAKELLSYKTLMLESKQIGTKPCCYTKDGKLIYPCFVYGKVEGYLVLEIEPEVVVKQNELIDRTILYLSAKLLENMMICKSQHNNFYATIDSILSPNNKDEETIRNSLSLLDFVPHECYRIIVFEDKESRALQSELADHVAHQTIIKEMRSKVPAVLYFYANNLFYIIISYSSSSRMVRDSTIREIVEQILNKSDMEHYQSAFDANQTQYMNFTESYNTVRHTLKYGNLFAPRERIYSYDNFEQVRIVSNIIGTSQQNYIQASVIKPILEYDKQYQASLWETLCVCLEVNSLSIAASSLFIHISTLRYRLQKIASLTKQDYFSTNGKFILQVAVIVQKLVDTDPSK